MMLYDTLIAPFAEFEFMRRALVGTFALSFSAAPIGVFLMLRRMSLIGDALAHAILPGAAIGFLLAGLSLLAMAGGGLIAGFLVAIGAGLIARATPLKEDASLAAFFLISLALGVVLVSAKGSNVDLMHFLFGSVLAVNNATLLLIAGIVSVSLVVLALIWRPLVLECVDPGFLRSVSGAGGADPYRLPGAGRHQPGRRLPGARHLARGRHHDVAGSDLAVLGARRHRHDRRRNRQRRDVGLYRAARLLPRRSALGPRHYSGGWRALCAVGRGRTGRRPDLVHTAAASPRGVSADGNRAKITGDTASRAVVPDSQSRS